ncbi:hypothetical protein FIBSPDRAFT_955742 [Athelia psychrophila]|uniref:Uncharacterized protein n=1 Tax=Athelia psychrophila TaxID=1759441 RepID=A0A166HL81_9AGAM|nr:hypothetical protein FIBSPDRAFT_955742 [Fibularhizoctonia sp. CBS 109695]
MSRRHVIKVPMGHLFRRVQPISADRLRKRRPPTTMLELTDTKRSEGRTRIQANSSQYDRATDPMRHPSRSPAPTPPPKYHYRALRHAHPSQYAPPTASIIELSEPAQNDLFSGSSRLLLDTLTHRTLYHEFNPWFGLNIGLHAYTTSSSPPRAHRPRKTGFNAARFLRRRAHSTQGSIPLASRAATRDPKCCNREIASLFRIRARSHSRCPTATAASNSTPPHAPKMWVGTSLSFCVRPAPATVANARVRIHRCDSPSLPLPPHHLFIPHYDGPPSPLDGCGSALTMFFSSPFLLQNPRIVGRLCILRPAASHSLKTLPHATPVPHTLSKDVGYHIETFQLFRATHDSWSRYRAASPEIL